MELGLGMVGLRHWVVIAILLWEELLLRRLHVAIIPVRAVLVRWLLAAISERSPSRVTVRETIGGLHRILRTSRRSMMTFIMSNVVVMAGIGVLTVMTTAPSVSTSGPLAIPLAGRKLSMRILTLAAIAVSPIALISWRNVLAIGKALLALAILPSLTTSLLFIPALGLLP